LSFPRTNVLGVGVSAIDLETALSEIADWIERKEPNYVCVTGVHGVMESHRDEGLRRIHNRAGLVTPDGMPLVWLSRLAGNRQVQRVYGPDLMLAVCESGVAKGYRHFFYGSRPSTLELLTTRLSERFPGLEIVGALSPPFRELTPEEEEEIGSTLRSAEADIVWVGLSTPKQERWMSAHVGRVGSAVLIGVGAAFDFHSGVKLQAPRWMQRSGFEWLFRMATEPRRLAGRYLVNNPRFVLLVLAQRLGLYSPEMRL
jgi:N-acetylglucosaminyldiphosphoundecaprenol N-acetyl-beta-D-mannosaminyltransferase